MKSLAGCEVLTTTDTTELMKDDGSQRFLVRGSNAKKDECGALCVKTVTEVLRKKVEFHGKEDITFRPDLGNALPRETLSSVTI